MVIKFLKAGSGDCILISHQKHNILIDGGNEPDYLLAEIGKIHDAKQHVNLLVITHHDDDHIKGILVFLERVVKKEYGEDFIKEVIFNSPRAIRNKLPEVKSQSLSYKQAYLAENLLLLLKTKWEICTEQTEIKTYGSLRLRFLSPLVADLDIYSKEPGAYLSSDFKCDWNSPIDTLTPYITDDSQDISVANRTSVVILAETDHQRVLLTGDITPDRFLSILEKLTTEASTERVRFDHIKLPHHTSYRSLNKAIIEKLDCKSFIISTNSKKYYLPNKRALIKILLYLKRADEETEFHFNYEEALNNLKITIQEQKKYRIKLTKNNQTYGVSI
jgi:beta-lactamase superfamily II metal-dependent hydrolase